MTEKETYDLDLLKRASTARPIKRFYSFLIDAVILIVLIYGCFYGGFLIATNTNSYKNSEEIVQNEIAYYDDLIEDTHLVYFHEQDGEKTRYENDVFSLGNIANLLIFSNNYDPTGVGWYKEFKINNPTIEVKDTVEEEINSILGNIDLFPYKDLTGSSYSSDDIAYFYTVYLPTHNENNDIKTISTTNYEEYFRDLFKAKFPSTFSDIFLESSDPSVFPFIINKTVAQAIFKAENFLNIKDDSNSYYDTISNGYYGLQEDGENLVLNSKSYQTNHYEVYLANYNKQGKILVLTILISYAVGFLAYMLTFKLIFKNETTLARKILSLGGLKYNNDVIGVKEAVFRMVFEFIFYFPLTFVFLFLPPFANSASVFLVTIFSIGSWNINLLIIYLIIVGLGAINFISMLLTHYKLTIVDLITKTTIRDKKHLDEHDYDERDEGAL